MVCTQHSLFDKHARYSKICTEQAFLICMCGELMYASSNRFYMHAKYAQSNRFAMLGNEICSEQPVLHTSWAQRRMHGATVLIMYAWCREECTKQSGVFICIFDAAKYAWSNRFLHACSVHRRMHRASVLYKHVRYIEVCTGQTFMMCSLFL